MGFGTGSLSVSVNCEEIEKEESQSGRLLIRVRGVQEQQGPYKQTALRILVLVKVGTRTPNK